MQLVPKSKKENHKMKRLMTITLGLSLLVATVGLSFAQETKKEESTMNKKGKKKSEKTTESATKKGG